MSQINKEELLKQVEQMAAAASENQTPVAAPEAEPTKRDCKCPRCGQDLTKPFKGAAKPEDRQEYLRCVLGMRPFEKKYAFLQGSFSILMRGVNVQTADMFDAAVAKMIRGRNSEMPLTPEQVKNAIFKSKLVLYVAQIASAEVGIINMAPLDFTKPVDVEQEYITRFGAYPEPVLQMLLGSVVMFEALTTQLMEDSFDKNFWEGAGPVSQ